MTVRLTFAVELRSDYHVSAGHGLAAEADSALLRDADGIPVLRGTALTGLLRDGMWRLLQLEPLQHLQNCQASGLPEWDEDGGHNEEYCGQFDHDADECPICQMFGTPRRPKHWRIQSARPRDQARVFSGPQSTHENRQIVHRVRIDPRTRRAEPRKLFSQEDGSGQLVFKFTATCQGNIPAAKDEAALLVAAARFVRQLGRSRRRGQGECIFTLEKAEGLADCPTDGETAQRALLDHFEHRWLDRQTRPRETRPILYALPQSVAHTRFRLIVRTDEPLLVAQRAEAGNQFEGLPVISGAAVRGAFAWQAARRHRLSPDLAPDYQETPAYRDFIQVFLRSGVQFPCLYPARYKDRSIYPTVPAPLDWLTCKVFPGLKRGGHGAVQAKDAPQQRCPRCGERMKVMSRFISLQSVRAEYEPPLCHEMHIRIDPERGRVTRGDLFTYVSVEAGQFYVGELVARHADDLRRFRALTGLEEGKTFTLHLGRANRRGYGRVTAWLQPLEPDYEKAPLTWVQLPLSQRVPNADDLITLTLLTDTIISDTWGRCAAGLGGWLSERLRLPVQVAETFVKVRTVDGFNAHLGLPRWRDLALAAGSVAYVRREGDWPEDWQARLAHAEQRSIGLRRNEGFGQIAFNHPLYQPDRTIRDSAIDLPRELHLERGQDELFREKWSRRLDRHTDRLAQLCRSAPFAAVARWLHANQGRTPATLKAWLATLGEPSSVLVEAIGEGEYGDRAKPNRLIEERPRLQPGDLASKEREKEGLGLIYTLLGQLEAEGSANWPTGITMLADRVAGVVVGKGEET